MHRVTMALLALLLTTCPTWADVIAPPLKKPDVTKTNVPITITYAVKSKVAGTDERPRLLIPKKLMVAAANWDSDPQAAVPNHGTLFTGIALAATFVTGGLWLVRRGGKGARALLVLFIVSGVLGASTFLPQVFGNIGPPGRFPPKTADPLPLEIKDRAAKLGVDIVITADGDRIQLVLPDSLAPAAMAKPAEAPKKAE